MALPQTNLFPARLRSHGESRNWADLVRRASRLAFAGVRAA